MVESRYLQYEKKSTKKVTYDVRNSSAGSSNELGILTQVIRARHRRVPKAAFWGFCLVFEVIVSFLLRAVSLS